jgi:hypothetical protein
MIGLWKRAQEYPKIGVGLDASETAVGPILEGAHSNSELIEAYLNRTGWMRVTVGSLLDSGSDQGIFSCSSPTRFLMNRKVYLLLYSVLTDRNVSDRSSKR